MDPAGKLLIVYACLYIRFLISLFFPQKKIPTHLYPYIIMSVPTQPRQWPTPIFLKKETHTTRILSKKRNVHHRDTSKRYVHQQARLNPSMVALARSSYLRAPLIRVCRIGGHEGRWLQRMHPNNGVLGAVALRHGTDLLGVTPSADDRRHHERLRHGQGKVSRVLYLLALLVVVNIREHQHERKTYEALIKKLTNLFLRAGERGATVFLRRSRPP
jgi:hypothetical protein